MATIVVSVALGVRGVETLTAFGLGAFAAGAAVRQLALAARRSGWAGLVGRANGGMVVHIGVVVIAVAFAASQSFGHRAEYRLAPGQSARLAGHRVTYLGARQVRHPNPGQDQEPGVVGQQVQALGALSRGPADESIAGLTLPGCRAEQ